MKDCAGQKCFRRGNPTRPWCKLFTTLKRSRVSRTHYRWGTRKGKRLRSLLTCKAFNDKNGEVLLPRGAASRVGQCVGPFGAKDVTNGGKVMCTPLDVDGHVADPNARNKLCTKFGMIQNPFSANMLRGHARRFFRPAVGPVRNTHKVTAVNCALTKHTACRGTRCAVKKYVRCHSVCQVYALNRYGMKTRRCSKRFCKGRYKANGKWFSYGAMACQEVAMMA